MRGTSIATRPTSKATCYFCGEWPACLYKNIKEKHSHRVCENCVAAGRVIRGEDGVYVTNPESPAEEAGSPDSQTRSSSEHEDAPDSVA